MTTRLNKGHIAALLLSAALILWMAAGSLQSEPDISTNRPLALDNGLPRVQVTHMQGRACRRRACA